MRALTDEQRLAKKLADKQKYYEASLLKSLEKYSIGNAGVDFAVCAICGYRSGDLVRHLKTHNITGTDYKAKYNSALISEKESARRSKKYSGENNPAYQHGGKYSPFSKKFIYADSVDRLELLQNVHKKVKAAGKCNTSIEYYLNKGHSIDEAKAIRANRQRTFSLDKCIEKHGDEKGRAIFAARQQKWQSTLNSREDIDDIVRRRIRNINGSVSKLERNVLDAIRKKIPNAQSQMLLKDGSRRFIYDICVKNKIIEVNGDYWHAHPLIFKETDIVGRKNKTAAEIWQEDELKKCVAIKNRV